MVTLVVVGSVEVDVSGVVWMALVVVMASLVVVG